MFLSTWLRNRKKSLQRLLALNQKQERKSAAHPLARTLLCLEVLEDRITPSGFQSLYSFTGGNDGKAPDGTLMVDASGNLVGTTSAAGVNGQGTVFQFNPSNQTLTTLHAFSTNSGYLTYQGLIQDSSGNFYGTTVFGGSANEGTVFELSPDGKTFTILHSFVNSTSGIGEGMNPESPLIMDGKGDLFGTTGFGSLAGVGTVFELSPNSSGGYNYTTLHSFNGSTDGGNPACSLSMDSSGNLYGVAVQGGADSHGTVFKLSPNGSGGYNFSVVYTFTGGNDGAQPYSNIVMDSKGNLYGTTTIDGANSGGTAYEINPSNDTLTTIYSFKFPGGYNPIGNLVIDAQGNLYGLTEYGGSGNQGTAFELSPNGTGSSNLTTLHNFSGTDGGTPFSGLIADSNGNLYGTTYSGGSHSDGTIFELTGVLPASTTTAASNATALFSTNTQDVTLTANVTSPAGSVNEGTVNFTVLQDNTVIGQATTSNTVSNGQASVSYALPANLSRGMYTIDAKYSGGADFESTSDTSHTLTITPANVTTTANSFSATYTNTSSQNLLLSASVADTSIPTDTVSEGTVTFTIEDSSGNQVGSVEQGTVSGGKASAYFTLPQAQPAGNYTINVSYSDSAGNFADGGDNSGTLTNDPSNADTTANNVSTAYSSAAQTLTLSANIADDIDPTETVGEGTVTFTVKKDSTTIGTAQGTVSSKDTASAYFNLPTGTVPGNYAIDVSYSDSAGNFTDFLDNAGKLTVTPANVTTTANNVSTAYATNAQTAKLSAFVANTSFPGETVNEGSVTFTVKNGSTTLGSVKGAVSGGKASADFSVPAGQVLGSYSIDVSYSDSAGNYTDTGDTSGSLTIAAAQVLTTANNVSTVYSSNTQTVNLSAALTDASAPGDTVAAGTVTFTVMNGSSTTIGSVQGTVANGTANANFDLPGGTSIGNYTIEVSYDDNGKGFSDDGDTSGTLTIAPATVVTTAAASNITFNPAAQTVVLDASVVNNSLSSDSVGEGTVTFTIETSQIVVGIVSAAVSGGNASADFNWTPGRAAGNYTIAVSYQDSQGNYIDSGDLNSTLTVAPALVTTTAANASAVYSPNTQTVILSASVSSPGVPIGTLDTDTVTFTIENGTTIVGSVQGAVSGGTANTNFNLPTGLAEGKYTIAASYSDSHGNFIDGGDTGATLTITPANVATTANNAVVVIPNSKSVSISAIVSDTSNSNDTVNEGAVTFTVQNRIKVIGNIQVMVSNGQASFNLYLPAESTAAGNYTIAVSYQDSAGNFSDNGSGDTSGTLTVLVAPRVTAYPYDQTVPVGGTAVFTAAAYGSPPLTVQWQVSTDGGKTFANISGATSSTLTLGNVQASQNGNEYQAVFTNSYGTATTSAATLTVPFAPTVTSDPSNQTVTAGQNATFTAAAGGSPTPTVQWQVSTDGGKTFTNISGATSTTLTLSNVQASQDDSEYQAVFTNSIGTATTSSATLAVQYAPTVTSNPSNQTATAGDEVTFTAAANGNPAPTMQWQVSTDGGKTFNDISGATNPILTLAGLTTAMSGNEYQAVFTNSIGSTTSSAATLTVNPGVIPVIIGNPISQTVSAGATVSFTASASGDPAPTVQWQVSTDGGASFSNISGATSTTLTLTGVTPAMNGYKYQAVFSNGAGSAVSTPVTLTVNAPPSSAQPITLNVPPLLALLGQLIRGVETVNANGTETVVYSLFGIALAMANYDGSGNFLSATLLGFSIPNSIWYL